MENQTVLELFKSAREEGRCLKIAAPMVRFSKLPFRHVVRSWGCELVYTPMIMAESFIASSRARDIEFTTNHHDRPVIVQFAAHDAMELSKAAALLAGKVDGVDINCGCPQRWAIKEGVGAALLKKPELVRDMVKMTRESSGLPVSIKIRTDPDLKETLRLTRLAEEVGVSFITLHGRTALSKPSDPVDFDAIRLVKEHLRVPLVANGDVKQLQDVYDIFNSTGADGAMAARGLLVNPAMFSGYDQTPTECVNDYVYSALQLGTRFEIFHKTLEWMLCEVLNKSDRIHLNGCVSVSGVLQFLRARGFDFRPSERLLPLL
mmetsp:Transcript_195/g.437  ORF Transcript_195/g.437 Transcript_195/m.437 type:complete len:319 (-) Transcript_195:6-962(-)